MVDKTVSQSKTKQPKYRASSQPAQKTLVITSILCHVDGGTQYAYWR